MAQHLKKIFFINLFLFITLNLFFSGKFLAFAQIDCDLYCRTISQCNNNSLCFSSCPTDYCLPNPTSGPQPTDSSGLPLGKFEGLGPLGNPVATEQDPGASAFTNFITKTIGVMTVVAFIWFIFVLFTGAIGWLSSGGDKVKLQEAQKKITTGLIGLIIVISAIFLIKLIGNMFDIDILDLTTFITNLGK